MSPNPCQVGFLQASKDSIHHLLYHDKVQIDKVHEILCHHGLVWVKEKQLKTTIKKWQSENALEWPPIPKPRPGRSRSNPCRSHIHCDLTSGICYSLYHNDTFDIENALSEPQLSKTLLAPNSIQDTGGRKPEQPMSSKLAPFQEVHTGLGMSHAGHQSSLPVPTSHYHLTSLNDSGMRPLSVLTIASSIVPPATYHSHPEVLGDDIFTTCESNISEQSISLPSNESQTQSLHATRSYTYQPSDSYGEHPYSMYGVESMEEGRVFEMDYRVDEEQGRNNVA